MDVFSTGSSILDSRFHLSPNRTRDLELTMARSHHEGMISSRAPCFQALSPLEDNAIHHDVACNALARIGPFGMSSSTLPR